MAMHADELRLALDSAGLGVSDLARWQGVQVRTAARWASGETPVPDDIEAALLDLIGVQARAAQAVIDRVTATAKEAGEDPAAADVRITVYRAEDHDPAWTGFPTAGAHRAVLRRLVEAGLRVTPVEFEAATYNAWRGDRRDTKSERAAWARSRKRLGLKLAAPDPGKGAIGWAIWALDDASEGVAGEDPVD